MSKLKSQLPGPQESPRCSEFNRQVGISPAGTAISADRLVLVSTPLPWSKPALRMPTLKALKSVLDRAVSHTRLLAVEPLPEEYEGETLTLFERVDDGRCQSTRKAVFKLDNSKELVELVEHLVLTDSCEEAETMALPAVLLCTQGSHDVCCGIEGNRLADELASTGAELDIYKVSHTGGHRFAPTAMTLPDGRMWAHLDCETLVSILDHSGDPKGLLAKARGWWGAGVGACQVAEQAVWSRLGWPFERLSRSVRVVDDNGQTEALCHVHVAQGDSDAKTVWEVLIAQSPISVISCETLGGKPLKPARQYEVMSVRAL